MWGAPTLNPEGEGIDSTTCKFPFSIPYNLPRARSRTQSGPEKHLPTNNKTKLEKMLGQTNFEADAKAIVQGEVCPPKAPLKK